jgi:hypothetical protein
VCVYALVNCVFITTVPIINMFVCVFITAVPVRVFITAVPIIKLFARGKGIVEDMCYERRRAGEGDSGGHVLRETTSRGLCGLVCPSRTSESKLWKWDP